MQNEGYTKNIWHKNPFYLAYVKKSSKFAGKFDIRRDLSALQSQGIIRRVGPDRGGHWEIIEQQ